MKNRMFRLSSIVMCILLLFSNLGLYASDTLVEDEAVFSSSIEEIEGSHLTPEIVKARQGKYYSTYSDAEYYDSSQELLLRANCYGYALRMFYAPNEYPNGFWYKQQPGEFAIKSDSHPLRIYEGIGPYAGDEVCAIANREDLDDFYMYRYGLQESVDYKMSYLTQLIKADAASLGYTVTEYTGSSIPNATDSRNSRLIAMVAGPWDYHFYMQHSDNTWSHKQGEGLPKNTCNDCGYILTNENIKEHACEGYYYRGAL